MAAASPSQPGRTSRTPSLTTSDLIDMLEGQPAAEPAAGIGAGGDIHSAAPDVSLHVEPAVDARTSSPEDGIDDEATPRTMKKLKKQNKRMTMSAIIAGSFINDEVGDTSSDEEEEEEEEEEDVGWEMLLLPLIHFGWYICVLAVSVNFLNLWLAVYQGGTGVRERLEHLVEDVVFVHQDVHGEIFSPEGFVRWVSKRLVPILSPPPEECYPGICTSLSSPAMPMAPNVPVWLEDDFNVKNSSLWAFGSVVTEFCASFLLAAPSGDLLQEIIAKTDFALPASGAQGVAVEGGVAQEVLTHIAGVSVCDAAELPTARCINVTLGSFPGPGSVQKALVWCADGPDGKCVGADKSKAQLAGWQGQANLRGSMPSPLQPLSSGTAGNACIRAQRHPSTFRLLLTSSRAVLADDQCKEVVVDDERIGDMLKGGFHVRLLISGVVAGAEFVKFNYVRVRQATQSEVDAAKAPTPGDAQQESEEEESNSDLPAHFPPGSTRLAPFYLSEHDILLRQVRGIAHVRSDDLKRSATFDQQFESKANYGSSSQYHWHPTQGPGAPGVSGFWGELQSRSFHLWYPDSGFTQVLERSMLLQPELSKNFTEGLLDTGWVDRRTRAIFVEFSLNSFDTRQAFPHLVRVVAEFSAYGHVELSVDVQVKTVDLLLDGRYGESAIRQISITIILSLALLALQSIVVFVSEAMEMRMLGFEYLENMWNVIDLTSVMLLVWSLVDFAAFLDILLGFLSTVQGKDSSVPTTTCMVPGARSCELFASHQLSTTLEKFVLSFSFFTSLHVLKFLKYATLVPALDIPFQAMLRVAGRVAALTFTVFVSLVAFAIMFTGFAGPHMNQFNEIHLSLLQMLSLVTSFDTNAMLELVEDRPLTGSLLRSMASFLIVIIMLTVFIAVLVEGYTLAVEADEEDGDIHHMYYNLIKDKMTNLRTTVLQHGDPRRLWRPEVSKVAPVSRVTPAVANSKSSSANRGKGLKLPASVSTPAGDNPPAILLNSHEDDILSMANSLFQDGEEIQKAGIGSRGNGALFRRKQTRIIDGSGSPTGLAHNHAHRQHAGHSTQPHAHGSHLAQLAHREAQSANASHAHGHRILRKRQSTVKHGEEVAAEEAAQMSKAIEPKMPKMPTMWGKAAVATTLARKAAQVKAKVKAGDLQESRGSAATSRFSRISQVRQVSTVEDKVSDLQEKMEQVDHELHEMSQAVHRMQGDLAVQMQKINENLARIFEKVGAS